MLSRLRKLLDTYRRITPGEKELLNQVLFSRGDINSDYPVDFDEMEIQLIEQVLPYTMTSVERLAGLLRAIKYVHANSIAGDIVECGVWRGGSMLAACNQLVVLNDIIRDIYLFDTFEGMSPPAKNDMQYDGRHADEFLNADADNKKGAYWCIAQLDDVKNTMSKTSYSAERIHFIKGKVEDTLPHPSLKSISLLRLDTDWYESTMHELNTLYDLVVPGGVIIFDDYGHWQGARQAIDEFFNIRSIKPFLNRMDYTGRLMIK